MVTLPEGGVYTVAEAARLARSTPQRVRRLAFGYKRANHRYEPVIHTHLSAVDGHRSLTFLELVEIMIVEELRQSFSLQYVRKAVETARRLFQVEHPLAAKRFMVDPTSAFVELERDDPVLVELRGDGQIYLLETIRPYARQLKFDAQDLASEWFPLGPARPVLVSPLIAFGAPAVLGTRVTTDTAAATLASTGDVGETAWWLGIAEFEVEAAAEFEREYAA